MREPTNFEQQIIDDYKAGLSFSAIDCKHGCSTTHARRVLKLFAPDEIRPAGGVKGKRQHYVRKAGKQRSK